MALRYINARIKNRRDIKDNLTSNNPLLYDGEITIEQDTGHFKFGDGVHKYNDLPYAYEALKNIYATIESPHFTGIPTAPQPDEDNPNPSQLVTVDYLDKHSSIESGDKSTSGGASSTQWYIKFPGPGKIMMQFGYSNFGSGTVVFNIPFKQIYTFIPMGDGYGNAGKMGCSNVSATSATCNSHQFSSVHRMYWIAVGSYE